MTQQRHAHPVCAAHRGPGQGNQQAKRSINVRVIGGDRREAPRSGVAL